MQMNIRLIGGKKVETQLQDYTIITDRPEKSGGEGTAPSPVDLFLTSIGTCTGFNVMDFCKERNIPTENINLQLTWNRNQESRMIEHIQIDINLPAEFPEKYAQAVKRAADQCTVKKHLHQPPEIDLQVNLEK